MVDYVIDASIVIHYLVSDVYTANAQAFFSQVKPGDRLIVPEFCLTVCTNVLWKQVRFFGMPQTQAVRLIKDLRDLPLRRTPVKRLLESALEIGLRHQLSVYDSIYIALASQLDYPLITVDQPQTRAAELKVSF